MEKITYEQAKEAKETLEKYLEQEIGEYNDFEYMKSNVKNIIVLAALYNWEYF